ncbi:hypothetical protein BV508_06365, partial [Mycobacterium intermedium]
MRRKLGRPDLAAYADRFNVPAAAADAPLSATWMGVATLLLDDGSSALMTDVSGGLQALSATLTGGLGANLPGLAGSFGGQLSNLGANLGAQLDAALSGGFSGGLPSFTGLVQTGESLAANLAANLNGGLSGLSRLAANLNASVPSLTAALGADLSGLGGRIDAAVNGALSGDMTRASPATVQRCRGRAEHSATRVSTPPSATSRKRCTPRVFNVT